jgi:hypothetical protein
VTGGGAGDVSVLCPRGAGGGRAISQGRTREEARENVLDALKLLLSPEPESESTEAESVELTVIR